MSIVSGTIGAINSKKSADKATSTNLKIARETNNANLVLDLARRGLALPSTVGGVTVPEGAVGKSSAILPYYLNDQEMAAAGYAGDIFDVLSADANAQSIGDLRASSERYRGAFDQARQDTLGVFDGSVTDEELAAAQPVAAARIKLANAKKDAGLEALQEKLNEIKAIQNRKGYTGDSLASQRLRFDATRKVLGDAAIDRSNAELANAMESSGIRRAGIQRRLSSGNLPLDQLRRETQFADMPGENLRSRAESNISIFNPFRVNGGFQTIQRPDQVEASPSTLGIIAGQNAAVAQDVGSYLARRNWGGNQQPLTAAQQGYINSGQTYGGVNATDFAATPSYGSYGSYGGADAGATVGYGYGGSEYDIGGGY
jgi:hypothetical protein